MRSVDFILATVPLEYTYHQVIENLHALWQMGLITSEEFRDCCISVMDAQIEFEREMARGEVR